MKMGSKMIMKKNQWELTLKEIIIEEDGKKGFRAQGNKSNEEASSLV